MTTAQSFPLTPNDVMFAAVIALNAYSKQHLVSLPCFGYCLPAHPEMRQTEGRGDGKVVAYRLGIAVLGLRKW